MPSHRCIIISVFVLVLSVCSQSAIQVTKAQKQEEQKPIALKHGSGTHPAEAAIGRGLYWLAKQQVEDKDGLGHWEFDHPVHKRSTVAATGLAMLPFLAGGETHIARPKRIPDFEYPAYHTHLEKALKFLYSQMGEKGNLATGPFEMYEHGIATLALCELTAIVGDKDKELRAKATLAAQYIIDSQAEDGSWGYTPRTKTGNTLVLGWQIQALYSAHLSGLKLTGSKKALQKAEVYLDSVMTNSKEGYNYGFSKKDELSENCTAVATLCRVMLGWSSYHPKLIRAFDHYEQRLPDAKSADLCTLYHATLALHHTATNTDLWRKKRNPATEKLLIKSQELDDTKNKGRWATSSSICFPGRLGATCMSLLILEVRYRHLPIYEFQNRTKDE